MSTLHIPTTIHRTAVELVDSDKLLTQLEDCFRSTVREAALRNDSEADNLGDALIDEFDREPLRKIVRAMLKNEGAEALRLLTGCFQAAYDKTVERQAESSLQDAIENDARDRAERMAARMY